jgi:hypothetical protein
VWPCLCMPHTCFTAPSPSPTAAAAAAALQEQGHTAGGGLAYEPGHGEEGVWGYPPIVLHAVPALSMMLPCWYKGERRCHLCHLSLFMLAVPGICLRVVFRSSFKRARTCAHTHIQGWSLQAAQPIPGGSFVCEYVGEQLSSEEARRRLDVYDGLQGPSLPPTNLDAVKLSPLPTHQDAVSGGGPGPGGHALLVRVRVYVC